MTRNTPPPTPCVRRLLAAGGLAGTSLALPGALRHALAQSPIAVGILYVGPRDDFGYNQAQAEAAALLKKLPGVKLIEEENVPAMQAVQKSMPGMKGMIAQDGATLLFPTSFGYFDPHLLAVAAKNPEVRFSHCGGIWTKAHYPDNTGSYFGYIDEAQYLNGVIAGHMSKSKKLGFVAAKPVPQVLRTINAFTVGARSVNPKFTTNAIFTGDWSMPVKEAEATNGLADQGVDLFTMHVDGHQGGGEDRRQARQDGVRLPRQPGQAGTQRLPHGRGVELAHCLHVGPGSRAQGQAAHELRARRAEGRRCQELA